MASKKMDALMAEAEAAQAQGTVPEWTGTAEQVAEAKALREAEDLSYGDLAARYGLPGGPAMKAALEARPAPASKLEALVRETQDRVDRDEQVYQGIQDEIRNSRGDPPITEEELDQLEYMYSANVGITTDEMAAALDPPRHWLTVLDALGSRGWYKPTVKTLPYSTGNKEGQERLARDRAAGRVPAGVVVGSTPAHPGELTSIRI